MTRPISVTGKLDDLFSSSDRSDSSDSTFLVIIILLRADDSCHYDLLNINDISTNFFHAGIDMSQSIHLNPIDKEIDKNVVFSDFLRRLKGPMQFLIIIGYYIKIKITQ